MSVEDAPSVEARNHISEVFKDSDYASVATVVLEGEQPLDDAARQYYRDLIRQFQMKTCTSARPGFLGGSDDRHAVQSADGEAAYVQLNLAGIQGESLANESVDAVREIVQRTPAPVGVKAYVTGPTPLSADLVYAGNMPP